MAVELEMQGLEKAQAMTQRIRQVRCAYLQRLCTRLAEESWAPLAPRSQGRPAQAWLSKPVAVEPWRRDGM